MPDRLAVFNRRGLIIPYIATEAWCFTAAEGAPGIGVPAATKRGSIHEKHKQSPFGVFAAPGIGFGVRINLAGHLVCSEVPTDNPGRKCRGTGGDACRSKSCRSV